ncbi:MAG: hypothetical protein F2789_11755, partial [Actinobacteria bacterium]|nr:hypothetical protein [Actinomycetota bacterium]
MTARQFRIGVGAGVVLAIVLHLRFLFTPLTADEGGFLAIGRAWGHGSDLYRQVWVDRPQGVLVVFRLWDDIAGGSTASVRIMATLFAVVAVIAAGVIARVLADRTTGVLAAIFVAALSSAPIIEGFIANGELLSGALSVAGLAVGCMVITGRWGARWMFASGVIAGCAMSIKQSGLDGFLAVFAWLVLALLFAWRERVVLLRWMALLIGGFAAVIGLLALHGALTGWHDWWFAFAGYRLGSRSALVGADWARLRNTMHAALPILGPTLAAAAICAAGYFSRPGRKPRNELSILALWMVAATAAFLSGGQFHRHYWVTLAFPIAVLGAVCITSLRGWRTQALVAAVVLLPAMVSSVRLIALPRQQVPLRTSTDPRLVKDEHMAHWYLANRAPGETMYIMCAGAAFYGNAREDPPFPYLWYDNVRQVPGARQQLGAMLTSAASRPTFVALYQSPDGCDSSGISSRAI